MNNWLRNNQPSIPNRWIAGLIQQRCILCQAKANLDHAFCHDCYQDLPTLAAEQSCNQCGIPTPHHICGQCLKKPPHFDHTQTLFHYHFPIDSLIQHYKYQSALHLAQTFGLLLAQLDYMDVDVLVPMPLHPNRLKDRGFNQSLEITQRVAKQNMLKVDTDGCEKVKDIVPQASLAYKERIKNIRHAFQCNRRYDGLHVGIIDDVMTTGATLNELAKTLKKSGAKLVSAFVLARAS